MVVSYFPGHKFAARVCLRADVLFSVLRPLCGEKDDPIYFDPEHVSRVDSARVKEVERINTTIPGKHVGYLVHLPLKKLTRLETFGGTFLQ